MRRRCGNWSRGRDVYERWYTYILPLILMLQFWWWSSCLNGNIDFESILLKKIISCVPRIIFYPGNKAYLYLWWCLEKKLGGFVQGSYVSRAWPFRRSQSPPEFQTNDPSHPNLALLPDYREARLWRQWWSRRRAVPLPHAPLPCLLPTGTYCQHRRVFNRKSGDPGFIPWPSLTSSWSPLSGFSHLLYPRDNGVR